MRTLLDELDTTALVVTGLTGGLMLVGSLALGGAAVLVGAKLRVVIPVLAAEILLSSEQRDMARLIFDEAAAEHVPPGIALAMVLNAYAESKLRPLAIGDNGQSVGLFQLYSGGAGAGMTVEQRQNPYINTRRILVELFDQGADIFDRFDAGAALPELTALFSRDIERPQHEAKNMLLRSDRATRWFPATSTTPARLLAEPHW